jgi:hypothetical protein
MSKETSREEILRTRMQNIKMDLAVVENNQDRLEEDRAQLILKLISTRETLMSLTEQDE